ncbi:MAG: hypothetical protein DRP97_06620 [Candidatus Latescibacterota bacterium]|nr:MAG: hypothetical protein DRP97_06620 [Candidatus Latescibacterota bacterium]
MEVKPGYKQTEVGVIPEDWESRALQTTCRGIYRGASPRPIGDPRWFDDSSAIGWVRIADITQSRRYLESTTQKLSADGVAQSRFIPRGSLIMSICATVGRPIETAVDTCIHDGFVIFDRPVVDQGYLYHVLCDLEPRWSQKGQTGSQMNLNTNLIKITPIPVPPTKAEQTAIATALSDVDALLDGLDRLIAKKRDLKQAAMQQLLTGKTRLPGFEGEWDMKRIDQIADIRSGGTPSTSQPRFWDGGIPWCTPTDITALKGRKYLSETTRTISAAGLRSSSAEMVPAHAIIMTSRATIGECAINTVPIATNQGFKNLIPRNDVDPELLYYLMTTQTEQLIQLCGGSTFLEISKKQLSGFEVMLPCDPGEQTAIAAVLSDMDAEIEALEKRRAKTADLKQAMMQELLTGKTRLVEPQVSSDQADSASSYAKGHNWAINEAVVISTLVKHFGKENYPLGRKRYTKLSYLLHRHVERQAEGYLKKAAGPYNPQTKYGGPEKIAMQNRYIQKHKGPKGHSGFIAADNIAQAEGYFEKWYGPEVIQWLEQFRYKKNDELEVLATVDMAAEELRASGKDVDVAAVKNVIGSHPEWEAKLDRAVFSDANIAEAIKQSEALMRSGSV